MMENIKLTFNLIKKNKWDKLKELLEKNKNININYKNKNGIYLINYLAIFNKLDVLEIIKDNFIAISVKLK